MIFSKVSSLILVDGSSYLFRAFHAMPNLSNGKGMSTGAVYGVVNMLKSLQKQQPDAQIVVIFDAKGPTFRHELFTEYKAHRPPMPEELVEQIKPLHELIHAMGLPLISVEGVEADDVIGTLARDAAAQGKEVLISTGDKDMAQLVNAHVELINTMTNTRMDETGVWDKFGVRPDQIIDYLALIGDKVDNIPGVPKVGPKTAAKWLQDYGDLDNLMARADEIKGKVGENLRASLEFLPLARELVTIRCDVKLDAIESSLQNKPQDREKLVYIYKELGFKNWLAELGSERGKDEPQQSPPELATEYQCILDESALQSLLERLQKAELVAFDSETTSLNYMQAEVVGLSFALQSGEACYLPLAHSYPGAPEQLPREVALEKLKPWLESEQHHKVGQNLKYDKEVLANHGIVLRGITHDTMLESYVLNSTASRHDMDSLALHYLNHQTIKYEDVAGKGSKQLRFDEVPLEGATPYAAEDADITLRLHEHLWPLLAENTKLAGLYQDLEIPLVQILARMERTGVLVDTQLLARQSQKIAERILELEKLAHELAGGPFNLGSPKQLQAILFGPREEGGLELPVYKKTPKGQPSTNEEVLQELAQEYELPRTILEHRSLAKLRSTYTDKLPKQVNRATGRIHTSYHQAVAATGRLSSSDPNLQNIPIRTSEGRRIRQAFIAPDGYRLLAADYSQIELRIMAHLSGDQGLLEAFAKGEDIHRATAAEVFDLALDEVDSEHRRRAKAINFGLIYGMSAFGLARQLDISQKEAAEYVELYFTRYPGVKTYMDDTKALAKEQGYVETLFGRRLYLPEINARNGQRRQYAERTAINAPMQGSAADIIKRAMLAVDKWLQASQADCRMIMQVHDELVFEVATAKTEELGVRIRSLMEGAAELDVPLLVDVGTGDNWDEAH